jgi:uncharacterized protein YjbI with pentapeptide repeats
MKFEIKSRWNSTLLFTCEAASLGLAVAAAVKSGANLSCANLSGANLSGADLSGVNLFRANLSCANLSCANLSYANLSGANLSYADLSSANLSSADLSGANLSSANLFRVNLSGADLSGVNLFRADLSRADLSQANLSGADLSRVTLSGANLSCANLSNAKNREWAEAQTSILPEGNIVGWKQCKNGVIVKLLVTQKVRRSNATGRKCRAESAKVLRVFGATEGISIHDGKTVYRKGETVTCDRWNENRFVECGGGIHFYLTRIEAEKQ